MKGNFYTFVVVVVVIIIIITVIFYFCILGGKKDNLKFDRESMRMCLLCSDGRGAMDVFPLKLPHHFNGGLLEYLAVAAATNGIDSSSHGDSYVVLVL